MKERRRNSRVVYNRPVELTLDNGTTVETWSRDFSMQGISIVLGQALAVGQSLRVKLELKVAERPKPVKLAGKVVYTRHHGDDFVSGIEFH